MPRPTPRELGTPEHLSALYDRVARLERRKSGGGVTGAGGFYTLHNYSIPLGTTTTIDTGWTNFYGEANSGVSLVSGIPTYAPGLYWTTILLELSWSADGFQDQLHTVQLQEAAVGAVIQAVNGNSGFYWMWQNWTWFTDPATGCGLTVQYHSGPSGSASNMSVSGTYFSALRLGDMP